MHAPKRVAPAGPEPRGRLARELPLVLTVVALSLWVYRGALGAYFSPDDLIYLERARGIVPESPTLWRFLSGPAYFHLMHGVFGTQVFPYMLANWLLHGLAVVALYAWMRSAGGGVLGATLAAGLFGTSRLFLTVVFQVVTVAEPLAMIAALSALWMASRPGRPWSIGAAVTFAAALLCKETVMLLPLVLLLPGSGAKRPGERALRFAVLITLSALMFGYLRDLFRGKDFLNDAYARAYGANLFHSLMTYTAWATDLSDPVPDLYSILSTTAWHSALWVMLGFATLAAVTWRTSRLPALGLAWWLLALAPVLPLLQQRYLHYMYVPFAGLTMALGAGLDWATTSRPSLQRSAPARGSSAAARPGGVRRILGWGLAAALVLGQVVISEILIEARAARRLPGIDMHYDPFLRKADTARRAIARVGEATAGRRVSAVFVVPDSGGSEWLARVLRSILGDGRALRLVHANLDSTAFVTRWSPAYREFELFYGRVNGDVVDVGCGPGAHRRLAELLIADGCVQDARANLEAARAVYPEDPGLRTLSDHLAAPSPRAPPAVARP